MRRLIQPYFANSWIGCSRKQKPDSPDALGGGAYRALIHVTARAQKIDSTQNIVRPHRRQIAPDLVRPRVGQPIAHIRPAIVRSGRMARLELENNPARPREYLRQL